MIVALEGTDGSGKKTQVRLLGEHLDKLNIAYKALEYPRYDKTSSALVKSYLGGEFGKDPKAVNAYAASSFYAVDRVASYLSDWKEDYEAGKLIVTDRYATSNVTHQGAKFENDSDRLEFFDWVFDYEHNRHGLPVADLVIFLDIPTEQTIELMEDRRLTDIHEEDPKHLKSARKSALLAVEHFGWVPIRCIDAEGKLRTERDIHKDIWECVNSRLRLNM